MMMVDQPPPGKEDPICPQSAHASHLRAQAIWVDETRASEAELMGLTVGRPWKAWITNPPDLR